MSDPEHPPAQRPSGGPLAAPAIATLFRGWSFTWRVRRHGFDQVERALAQGPVVFAFWHGEQVAYIGTHRHLPVAGMASLSPDGELLARTIHLLGYELIRGSTSRGGRGAFRASLQAIDAGLSPALAVDGPRGPRHRPHVGAVAMAAARQRPVFWCLTRARPALRLKTWDRFELPLPFATVDLHYGRFEAPVDAGDRDGVEQARAQLAEVMRARWEQLRGEPAQPLPPEWHGPVVEGPVSASEPTPR